MSHSTNYDPKLFATSIESLYGKSSPFLPKVIFILPKTLDRIIGEIQQPAIALFEFLNSFNTLSIS